MALPQSTADALAKVDADTTALAAVVTSLRAIISTSMTAADVALVDSTLAGIASRLEATAVDPANPVPPGPLPQAAKRK